MNEPNAFGRPLLRVANALARWQDLAALRIRNGWKFLRKPRGRNAELTPRGRQIYAALKTAIARRRAT